MQVVSRHVIWVSSQVHVISSVAAGEDPGGVGELGQAGLPGRPLFCHVTDRYVRTPTRRSTGRNC